MKDLLKVGDILIAIDKCIMPGYGEQCLTINKEYAIKHITWDDIYIIDDSGDIHYFRLKELSNFFIIKKQVIINNIKIL